MYYTSNEYDGKIDVIIVDNNGRAITVWMDEEPIIIDGNYLLKYQTLDGEKDGITKTKAKYLMLAMGKGEKIKLHFLPISKLSQSIMFEEWSTIESKKMNGRFFEIPIEWIKKMKGLRRI